MFVIQDSMVEAPTNNGHDGFWSPGFRRVGELTYAIVTHSDPPWTSNLGSNDRRSAGVPTRRKRGMLRTQNAVAHLN